MLGARLDFLPKNSLALPADDGANAAQLLSVDQVAAVRDERQAQQLLLDIGRQM
jgi:hypothetical protein